MKKKMMIAVVALFCATTIQAQLYVDYSGKVGVGQTTTLTSALTVGPSHIYQQYNSNIGLAASPKDSMGQANIGVEGVVNTYNTYPLGSFVGVRGVVYPNSNISSKHNYGVTGIVTSSTSSGGTGILGSSVFSSYYAGPNIQGTYAGYFLGNVYVSGNVTASQVTTTSDIRLKENVVEFGEGSSTIDKIIGLKVLEYNLKDWGDYDITEEAEDILREKQPEVLDEIEKRKEYLTSKRHFGLSAQELMGMYPNLVTEGTDGYYSVNYVELVPVLIRCIQELKQELDELKAEKDSNKN